MAAKWLFVLVACALVLRIQAKTFDMSVLKRALAMLREEADEPKEFGELFNGKREHGADDGTDDEALPGFAGREVAPPEFGDSFGEGKRELATDGTDDDGLPGLPSRGIDESEFVMKRDEIDAPQKRGRTNTLNLCYFCDDICKAEVGGNPQAYFDTISSMVQDLYSTLSDDTWIVKNHMTVEAGMPVPYYKWYNFGTTSSGSKLATDVTNNFWKYRNLWTGAQAKGCDIGLTIVSETDDLWKKSGYIDGVAHMFKLCSDLSFGTVKNIKSKSLMATTVAHECGHLVGMYHDGALNKAFSKGDLYTSDPVMGPAYQELQNACTGADHHCPLGQNNCVMRAGGGASTQFSGCSKAYVNMFFAMSETMPQFYKSDCIKQ